MSKNIFLVSYDISNNKNRNKIAKLLEQYGYERIQLSVFTGLTAPHRNKELWPKLQQLAEPDANAENKIICFAISKKAFLNMRIIGNFSADLAYLLGQKHTEIL